jgi:flavin-dependent dehydrogenase
MDKIEVNSQYDVVICGGGLAGLTLARQLKLNFPDISVLLLDKLARPLRIAALKVGESTVEVAAHYLGNILQMSNYFTSRHLRKLGLRFFLGSSQQPLQSRPEFGLAEFPPVTSYQIDRGILENDLRQLNQEAGVVMLEGCSVDDIILSNEGLHSVIYRVGNGGTETKTTVQAKWVIDAMGRRRFLQTKLKLGKEKDKRYSAAWFRLAGRIDIEDMVPASETEWHNRVPNKIRYFSTNHLMNDGYWVWVIPLSSGITSVGIVTTEEIHPFGEYHNYEKAMKWLDKNEPQFANYIRGLDPIDFLCMRHYSYTSKQVFSYQRWGCIGDAGVFPDPFFSPGSVEIGIGNTLLTEMIRLDREGNFSEKIATEYNDFYLSFHTWVGHNIQIGYPFFGNPMVMGVKLLWDIMTGWSFTGPLVYNLIFLDNSKGSAVRAVTKNFFAYSNAVQKLFVDWSKLSSRRGTFQYLNYLKVPFVRAIYEKNLQAIKSTEELVENHKDSMARLEELAHAIFLLALEDTMPEKLKQLPNPLWLNVNALSLDSNRWKKDGLFKPTTPPRDFSGLKEELHKLFHFQNEG